MPPHAHHRQAGFTLADCAIGCAIVGVFASLALPSFGESRLRAGRLDAVAALTRVQAAQEQHRALHGLYAGDIGALRGASAASTQGRYTIVLQPLGADAYRATAQATGEQGADRRCATLTLDVRAGFPTTGPSAACWMR